MLAPDPESPLLRFMGDSCKVVVGGVFFFFICYRRDASTFVFFLGSIINALCGKTLKRVLCRPRPDGSLLGDPGMPSSHATSLCFIGTFTAMWVEEAGCITIALPWRIALYSLLVGYTLINLWWRVEVGHHTYPQVVGGLSLGEASMTE